MPPLRLGWETNPAGGSAQTVRDAPARSTFDYNFLEVVYRSRCGALNPGPKSHFPKPCCERVLFIAVLLVASGCECDLTFEVLRGVCSSKRVLCILDQKRVCSPVPQ